VSRPAPRAWRSWLFILRTIGRGAGSPTKHYGHHLVRLITTQPFVRNGVPNLPGRPLARLDGWLWHAACVKGLSTAASQCIVSHFPARVLTSVSDRSRCRGSARILVVDDTRANAEALAASLAIDGFATRFALGGVDALQQLNPWQPHIFVLDITMPEHNGFAVARVLRRISSGRDAGIIAFTVLGKDEFAALGPAADFDGYVSVRASRLERT
jgi:two-component system, OmpR family, response regulator